jgi:hypothetical protein
MINCVGGVWEFEDPARYENRLNGLFFHRILRGSLDMKNFKLLNCLLVFLIWPR